MGLSADAKRSYLLKYQFSELSFPRMTNHLASSLFCGQQLCLASAELIPAVVNKCTCFCLWICWTCSSSQLFLKVDCYMVDVVTRMTCLNEDSLEDVKHSQRLSRCHARAIIRTRVQPK